MCNQDALRPWTEPDRTEPYRAGVRTGARAPCVIEEIEINMKRLSVDAFRSKAAGGRVCRRVDGRMAGRVGGRASGRAGGRPRLDGYYHKPGEHQSAFGGGSGPDAPAGSLLRPGCCSRAPSVHSDDYPMPHA